MSEANGKQSAGSDPPAPHRGPLPAEDGLEVLEEFSIVNEFAVAWIRKVRTRNGERLEVHSPRFGYTLRLDALMLEGLSWQSPETTSEFLNSPLGPESGESRS